MSKRDDLLAEVTKQNGEIDSFKTHETDLNGKITELTDTLKKNSPEENKKYLETQLAAKDADWQKKYDTVIAERDKYKQSHLKRLQDDAVAEGIKDLQFVDGLKDGFVARVLVMNNFEAKEIAGETKFVNKDMKEVKDVMHEFALSSEGKAYLKNPSSGGGASGSGNSGGGAADNPWDSKHINLTKQAEIFRNNPTLAKQLMSAAGMSA